MSEQRLLIDGLAAASGTRFFTWLAGYLAKALQADMAVVGSVVGDDWERVKVLGSYGLTAQSPAVGTTLRGGPWSGTLATEVDPLSVLTKDACRVFPDEALLASCACQGLGRLWLCDPAARPLGVLAVLSRSPFGSTESVQSVLEKFRERVTSELQTLRHVDSLRAIVEATAPAPREEVYRAIVESAVRVLGVDVAYVAHMDSSKRRIRTLALRDTNGSSAMEYDVSGSPCERVYEQAERVFFPRDVCTSFPQHQHFHDRSIESYLALPLFNAQREVIGHIALAHTRPMNTAAQSEALLETLASRAAAELQHQREEEERTAFERKLLGTQKLESLGVLAGGIAHDFNNLLVGILGNASLAVRETSPSSPIRPYLGEIEAAARKAADLARQMLAYSGKGQFTMLHVDLSTLVEDMTNLLQVSLPKKVVIRYNLSTDLPAIQGDPTQLRQLVMNLVLNGAEAIGEKSGVVSVTTGLVRLDRAYLRNLELGQDLPEGEYVYLEVADTGCGMVQETILKIFDPFFTTKSTGRGLGLAAAQGIVRSHGGAIKVYSELRRGTTFKLLFPAADGAVERLAQQAKQRVSPLEKGACVLVCDDEDSVRAVAGRMIEVLGAEVVQAAHGKQALEIFRERANDFALVMLDLNMPFMSGADVYRELRRLKPDARVVLMSGYNEEDAASSFAGKGLAGFLQKPFSFDELESVLAEAFAKS